MLKDSIITYLKEQYEYKKEISINIINFIEHENHIHVIFYVSYENTKTRSGWWRYKQELNISKNSILMCDRINKIKDILC